MKKNPFEIQKSIFEKAKKNAHIIFDIGAYIGNITDRYEVLFTNAEFYCFEPIPSTFNSLKSRFLTKKNIHCFNVACGESQKEVNIWEMKNVATSSLYKPSFYLMHSENKNIVSDLSIINSHKIPQITLDQFCCEKEIPGIDILKMDVQGNELNVLKGASSLLDNGKIGLVYTEILFSNLYEGQCYYHDIATYLQGKKYELFDFTFLKNGEDGKLYFGDAIFLGPEILTNYSMYV